MTLRLRAHPLLCSWRVRTAAALALLGLSPGTASAQAPALRPAAAPPVSRPTTPAARPTTPPAARPTTTPAARPTTPPAARPTTPAARPTTPAARPTTSTPRPMPAPRPTAPPADVGPPPALPDLGAPPSLPPIDAPPATTTAPSTGAAPQRPTPTPLRPTSPAPLRPTAPAPSTPIPEPAPPVAPPPVMVEMPPPPAPGPPVPADMSPVPSASPPPVGDSALRAPTIGGDDLSPASDAPKPLTAEDIEALAEKRAQEERRNPKKWRHGGLVFDLQIGTAMCFRQFCRSDTGHNAAPGLHLGGFFGGNVLGILEIGLEAGWNTLRPREVAGRNAVNLYGLDPVLLQQEISEQQGVPVEVDFSTLVVNTVKSRALNVGPSLRIHFIRKGRGLAYVGTGLHYQLWRNRYTTAGGDLRLDFHGISAPFKIGGGAYVHPNIAITGEFTYSLALYVLGGVNHPDLSAVAPLSIIESTAVNAGASLTKGLPHFGKFAVNVRFRF